MGWPRSAHQPLRRTFDTAKPHAFTWPISKRCCFYLVVENEPRPASSDKFTNPNAVRQYVQKILKPTCPSAGHATISSQTRDRMAIYC
jgi:hypothetical protein